MHSGSWRVGRASASCSLSRKAPSRNAPARERVGRDVYLIAAAAIVGMLMTYLDTSIVNVGLQRLSTDLSAPLGTIQWVTTAYLLALAAVIPLSGWATERFGTKRVWMISLGLFCGGSVLCGFAWSAPSLIGFRAVQGLGGGLILPIGMSVMAQAAGPGMFGRVSSIMALPVLGGPMLGPLIGGLILTFGSWRWMFFVNVPVTVVAIAMGIRYLPADPASARSEAGRLDWLGLVLLCPGLTVLVFGLSETRAHGGLAYPLAFGPMAAGAALVVLFALHSVRAPRPLLDVRLFRMPGFSAASISVFLAGGAIFGTWLVLPLYFQLGRGLSPLAAGALVMPQALGVAISSPIAGRLTDRIGGGRVSVVGALVMTLATVPLALSGSVGLSLPVYCLLLFGRGLGFGATLMPSMAAAYALLDRAAIPRATSLLTVLQRVGGTVAITLFAVVLQRQLGFLNGVGGGDEGIGGNIAPAERTRVAGQLNDAFAHTWWWVVGMTALAIASAAIVARARARSERVPRPALAG